MRYPTMGKNPRNAVSVPALSGGVNLADALNLVDDNQMTDCKNVWYKDGFLQTRPGIQKTNQDLTQIVSNSKTLIPQYIKNSVYIDDVEYKGMYVISDEKIGDTDELQSVVTIDFFAVKSAVDENSTTSVSNKRFVIKETDFFSEGTMNFTFNGLAFYNAKPTIKATSSTGVVDTGKGLYAYASFLGDYVFLFELIERKYPDNTTEELFGFLNSNELYAPYVYINGKSEEFYMLSASVQNAYAPSTDFEGHSAISNAYACYCFTTDARGNSFVLPDDFNNCKITIEYTDPNTGRVYKSEEFAVQDKDYGTGKYDITMPVAFESLSGVAGINDSKKDVNSVLVYFATNYSDRKIFFVVKSDGTTAGMDYWTFNFKNSLGKLTNNLKILIRTLPSAYEKRPKSNFARMTVSSSFGSDSEGVMGGNRIFLSGSSGVKKNMIAWSDIDKPTYFSENNYMHVGDSSQQITNIQKQDNMLVIFKTNELFYTVKITGSSYTAEDVIAGKVIDVATLDSTFPLIQISDQIGCDKPLSVKLCGNRLVWAHKNNIYMLRSANQYSTANVAVISNMLGKLDLSNNSSATTLLGHYALLSRGNIYLLNYEQYYFNSLPQYSDSQKANRKLQWYIWNVPISGHGKSMLFSDSESLMIHSAFGLDNDKIIKPVVNCFDEKFAVDKIATPNQDTNQIEENEHEIETVVQTKMFDFGAMERFKSIEQMYVGFGKKASEIALEYLTENGTLQKLGFDVVEEVTLRSPEFVTTKRFLPGIKRALRFGVRITAKGKLVLDGILIKFKYMGVKR